MKTLFTRLILTVVCCAFMLSPRAQIKKYPSTLLWRITGKELSKPSYLFGTMHVTDRSVFYFSDSLYRCLERAEGYAMELDPDTAFTALFRSIFSEDTSGLVKDAVDKQAFAHTAKRMEAELGIPASRVTKKQLWLYSFKSGHDKKPDDMDAPVDTYLYNIARRQGKWVGGIEDLEDQVNLMEELGSKFDADALLDKAKDKAGLEEITRIYKAQDLDRIVAWTDNADSSFHDAQLNRRNLKMARRIDSMASLRSIFFAVGAAHLPGKAGLIKLLRDKGYTVEPILSDKKIAPEDYTYKAVDIPWKTVQDEDSICQVQMPGNPFPIHLANTFTMHCFPDLGTGILYFFIAYEYPFPPGNPDSLLSVMSKAMARNGDIEKQATVESNGARGVELHTSKQGYFYRVRTLLKGKTLYVVMTGSEKKKLIDNAESERFFSSLVIREDRHPVEAGNGQWTAFVPAGKGVSIDLPGKPERNKQMEQLFRKSELSYGWNLDCYGYSDAATGNYYMVTIKDIRNGYFLQNDTSVFTEVRENARLKGADILSFDTLTYNGYRAASIRAVLLQTNLGMHSFMLCRGNRIYSIMGMHENGKGDTAAIDRFMHSFRLLDITATGWQEQKAPDASCKTWAPAAFAALHTPNQDTSVVVFSAYDSLNAISYQVEKSGLQPFYWAASDSSFFAHLSFSQRDQWNDSLLLQHETLNGHAKGMEYIYERPASNNLKRVRIIPGGDSVYILFSHMPRQLVHEANVNRFFDSFSLAHEPTAKPWLDNKAGQLLEALHSADSATAEKARAALGNAAFTREDLPLLHRALLYPYRKEEETTNYSIYNHLTFAIAEKNDSSTLSFIAAQYHVTNGENEQLKYRLLSVLAQTHTAASYALLQKLLLKQVPKTGDPGLIKYHLFDSLALTATLFPGLLPLSKDTLFIKIMPYILIRLADSNLLSLTLVAPYRKEYYAFARRELSRIKNADWDYESKQLIRLLGRFNTPESNTLLQEFLRIKSTDIREEAALALVKNNQLVAPAALEKIAADKSLRLHLYTELVKYKKEKLFPALYHTQKSLSESELYIVAADNEFDSISIRFAETRKAMYMGKMQIFHLFAFTYNNEDGERVSRLGVAGPYAAGSTKLVMESDIARIVWDEEYAPHRVTTQLKKVIEEAENKKKKNE